MIKRDFYAWDFIKQEPKRNRISDYPTIDGGTIDDGFLVYDGNDWMVNYTTDHVGRNNIILGGENVTISADINDTVFVQNLSVAGTTDIPPQEGQMRTIMDDGYWLTQVYLTNPDDSEESGWVTMNTKISFITADENFRRKSRWTRFKNWVGSVLS